jgi:hypothetical protein
MAILAAKFKGLQQAGGRQFEAQVCDDLTKTKTAITATETSEILDLGNRSTLRLDLNVSAVGGSPKTLDVTIEHSKDGTTFTTLGTFAQKTAISAEHKVFGGADRYVRAVFTVAGTNPSFTKTLTGFAV